MYVFNQYIDFTSKHYSGDKIRCMRWAGNVAHMEGKNAYRVLVGKLNERDHLECLGVAGR
jgi:hypothetical protein